MLTVLRILSLCAAVLFFILALASITLISEVGYVILLWLLLFLILGSGSIFAFRILKKRQLALGKQPSPATTGTVLIIIATTVFICFVAALLIPGLIHTHSPQKRSMADIRTIGVALEAYALDHDYYPETASVEELSRKLSPAYVKEMPILDGWKHPYLYQAWKEKSESKGPDNYAIVSTGKDGEREPNNLRNCKPNQTKDVSRDIIWRSGIFIQWPEGINQ